MADPYALSGPLPGALQLPDGTWIRARSLRNQPPIGPDPHFGIYLGIDYQPVWEHIVVAWPDFWLPRDPAQGAPAQPSRPLRSLPAPNPTRPCPGSVRSTTDMPSRPRGNAAGSVGFHGCSIPNERASPLGRGAPEWGRRRPCAVSWEGVHLGARRRPWDAHQRTWRLIRALPNRPRRSRSRSCNLPPAITGCRWRPCATT